MNKEDPNAPQCIGVFSNYGKLRKYNLAVCIAWVPKTKIGEQPGAAACRFFEDYSFSMMILPKYSGLWKSGAGATMGAHEPKGAFAFSSHL